ncbi:3-deoxy-7-phosphoheptulonate synthase [Gehongia tenuis]|uniref:3-deoxy-7-phosphoheptulonate synthase n=1 Tax=Gehongia tenuis TaxID=2763655 RepID=A0A926D5V4_9FIRM|nr:3-deoxy-7-phosphoheptulonate synthase [Gehongia tenuis]MBC8532283.1 3-deoxy-7-phosphoheptulonate synthase [Gehongia tenuis]
MIVVMKAGAKPSEIEAVKEELIQLGLSVDESRGAAQTVLGVVGDAGLVDKERMAIRPGVERVVRVQEPFKRANRKFHPDDTIVKAGSLEVGGKALAVMAGPCSVESEEQVTAIAKAVKAAGASALRGGAFKPRTSPYAFQGMGIEGIRLLVEAKKATGLPIVSEMMSPHHLELFEDLVDVIQIGARNMQNFDLLKEVGASGKPVLLKRGLSSTIEEWLMSAEYIMAQGDSKVILCERGIRTFETYTRNTLDLSAIPVVKRLSHLPVIVDPSHASGQAALVEPLAMAAIAAGADGLIIEVHNNPACALCDGAQSINPDQFASLMERLSAVASVMGRTL